MKKSFFIDGKDWRFAVDGDWRDSKGKVIKYNDAKGLKVIRITGGEGFYWFFKGEFQKAIHKWLEDLNLIKKIEKEEKLRFHKGLFYYQIAISYHWLGDDKNFKKFKRLALREDLKTYGTKSYLFPAYGIKDL